MKTIVASTGLSLLIASGWPALAQETSTDEALTEEAAATDAPDEGAADADPTTTDTVSLAEVIAGIEAEDRFGYIDTIRWNEQGYWSIDYRRDDGARIMIDIDAATGGPWSPS